jgi:hypothetical protein
MAGGFVIGGSIFLVLSVFDTFTTLNSVEMRDEITKVLSSPTGAGLGLSLSEAKSFMRVGLMIAAACAAAAAVLGVYALQGNRAARVALTVLAIPILLTAPLTGGLIGALVAAATLALWSGPARDWFAGRPIRDLEPPARQSRSQGPWETTMPSPEDRNRGHEEPSAPPPVDQAGPADSPADGSATDTPARKDWQPPAASELSTTGSSTAPVPTSGFGERLPPVADPQPTTWIPPTYADVARGTAVPVTVKVAAVLTWVFSGLVALLYAGVLLVLVFAQDRLVELVVDTPEWQRANLDQDVLVPALWIGCLMFLGWSVSACLLAWFAWRRHNWARWLLAASSATALLAGFFAFPVGVLHQLAAGLTIAGLFSAAARAWYARQPWTPGPPPGPPLGPPPGDTGWQSAPPPDYPSAPPPQPDQGQPDQGQPDQGQPDQGQPPPPPGGKPPVW